MIIKPLISAALLVILAFALIPRQLHWILRLSLTLVVVFGLWMTWSPDTATEIANIIGVGRGADLIFYMWMLISIIVVLILYLRMLYLSRLITKLARHIALQSPITPRSDFPADDL